MRNGVVDKMLREALFDNIYAIRYLDIIKPMWYLLHLSPPFCEQLYYYFALWSGGEASWWVCLCVCLSVCLSASISPEPHMRSLRIFLHVAYGRGSVLRQGNEIPRGRGQFWGFSSPLTMHCNALATNNIMEQQTEPFRGCRGWWECTDSAGEMWSTIALLFFKTFFQKRFYIGHLSTTWAVYDRLDSMNRDRSESWLIF